MRILGFHFSIVVFLLSAITCPGFAGKKDSHPNVILIVADDMGLGDLGSMNGGMTKTPSLDAMKDKGVWFENAFSAAPVCAPARASLLTGMYPHRTGCVTLNMRQFPENTRIHKDLTTMADIFKSNGYVTGLVGKWHTGDEEGYEPLQRGFDEFEGFYGYDVPDYFDYYLRVGNEKMKVSDKYLTHDISDRAINFVKRHKDEPFFLHLAHYAPHRPLGAPRETTETYLNKGYNEKTATIYAMIEEMDRGIGELLNELEMLGLSENTWVIFTSDNGPDPLTGKRFNIDLKGEKYTVNEGGIKVPFLFLPPGDIQSSNVQEIVHFTDVLPTLVELCNLEMESSEILDGASFKGLLYGEDVTMPASRCWQWNRGIPVYSHNAAIREGKWKLVKPFITYMEVTPGGSDKKPVLYNLEEDPGETTDVSNAHQQIYHELRKKLEHWSRQVEKDRLRFKGFDNPIIINGDFETGDLSGWENHADNGLVQSADEMNDPSHLIDGEYSYFKNWGPGDMISQVVELEAGEMYTLSYETYMAWDWIYINAAVHDFFNDDELIAETNVHMQDPNTVSVDFTAPESGFVKVLFNKSTIDADPGRVGIDNVLFEKKNTTSMSGVKKDIVKIQYSGLGEYIATGVNDISLVSVYSIGGQLLRHKNNTMLSEVRFNLNDQPRGLYIVRCEDVQGNVWADKIVKK